MEKSKSKMEKRLNGAFFEMTTKGYTNTKEWLERRELCSHCTYCYVNLKWIKHLFGREIGNKIVDFLWVEREAIFEFDEIMGYYWIRGGLAGCSFRGTLVLTGVCRVDSKLDVRGIPHPWYSKVDLKKGKTLYLDNGNCIKILEQLWDSDKLDHHGYQSTLTQIVSRKRKHDDEDAEWVRCQKLLKKITERCSIHIE